jgi:hypothetical protein
MDFRSNVIGVKLFNCPWAPRSHFDSVAHLTARPTQAQSNIMTGEQIPSLITPIIDELRARGVLITNRGGDWCVNLRGGSQATEYLTDDLQEAFEHGRAMAPSRLAAPAPEKPPEIIRRKWRKRMSTKAQRRRMIKAHNYRLRARAIKKQREERRG